MKQEFDFTKKWVEYIKTNPDWRGEHNKFLNAQLVHANKQLKKLSKEKLAEIFKIKNKKLLEQL